MKEQRVYQTEAITFKKELGITESLPGVNEAIVKYARRNKIIAKHQTQHQMQNKYEQNVMHGSNRKEPRKQMLTDKRPTNGLKVLD